MRLIALAVALAALGAAARASAQESQQPGSAAAARIERLRSAWLRQDAAGVVGGGRVVIQLPGQGATAPLSPPQASRALEALFRDAAELGLEVTAIRAVEPGTVYAELRRRYQVRGTQEPLVQLLFAAFRREASGGWGLVELRASAPAAR